MTNNNLKALGYGIGAVVVLGFLFGYPIMNDPNRAMVKAWNGAGIGCLSGHTGLAKHIHQNLVIRVDGELELISGEYGVVPGCMAEAHIHKGDPKLHVETLISTETVTLGQFFTVYGKPIQREGYKLEMTVNGVAYTTDPAEMILEDGQQIAINYTSTGSANPSAPGQENPSNPQ